MLRVRGDRNQSFETLYEVLKYEKNERKHEKILTTGIARNRFEEILYFCIATFILAYIGLSAMSLVIGILWMMVGLFFLLFGIRTYYVVRESAIVEHFFNIGNLKNTFLLKNIASISAQ